MRILVTTRADLFEERKRQHLERGWRIEDERPIPINGLCSFVAVRDMPVFRRIGGTGRAGVNGKRASYGDR